VPTSPASPFFRQRASSLRFLLSRPMLSRLFFSLFFRGVQSACFGRPPHPSFLLAFDWNLLFDLSSRIWFSHDRDSLRSYSVSCSVSYPSPALSFVMSFVSVLPLFASFFPSLSRHNFPFLYYLDRAERTDQPFLSVPTSFFTANPSFQRLTQPPFFPPFLTTIPVLLLILMTTTSFPEGARSWQHLPSRRYLVVS